MPCTSILFTTMSRTLWSEVAPPCVFRPGWRLGPTDVEQVHADPLWSVEVGTAAFVLWAMVVVACTTTGSTSMPSSLAAFKVAPFWLSVCLGPLRVTLRRNTLRFLLLHLGQLDKELLPEFGISSLHLARCSPGLTSVLCCFSSGNRAPTELHWRLVSQASSWAFSGSVVPRNHARVLSLAHGKFMK